MATRDDIRWGQKQRFEFIEWRAYWVGRVNRGDLEERFKISTQQASADLGSYQEVAQGNLRYDASGKTYIRTREFQPKYLKTSADHYLRQLNAIFIGTIATVNTCFGSLPPVAVTPTINRSVKPETLQSILEAIQARDEIDLVYQSLTNTRERTIAPHSLAFEGHRWHVRAWCSDHKDFRDFVLSRISSVGDCRPSAADPTDDMEWNTLVELRIAPHPALSDAQKSTIECDFCMDDGILPIETKVALSYYVIKRLNLDIAVNVLPPERQQVVLTNLDEVQSVQRRAKQETKIRLTKQ